MSGEILRQVAVGWAMHRQGIVGIGTPSSSSSAAAALSVVSSPQVSWQRCKNVLGACQH